MSRSSLPVPLQGNSPKASSQRSPANVAVPRPGDMQEYSSGLLVRAPRSVSMSPSMLPTAPIRVLLADDIPELRTLLRTTLQGRGLQLVGEAADGRDTLALAVDREPDVVVLDLDMPGVDGPDLVAELRLRARRSGWWPFRRSRTPSGVTGPSAWAPTPASTRTPTGHAGDDHPRGLRAGLRAPGPATPRRPGRPGRRRAGAGLEHPGRRPGGHRGCRARRPLPQGQPGPVRARRPPRGRPAGRRLPGRGPSRGPRHRHRAAPAPARRRGDRLPAPAALPAGRRGGNLGALQHLAGHHPARRAAAPGRPGKAPLRGPPAHRPARGPAPRGPAGLAGHP